MQNRPSTTLQQACGLYLGPGSHSTSGHCKQKVPFAGEHLGQGAAASILLWAAASRNASDTSALDAFKRSVTAVAESQGTCSISASVCADCIREDGSWRPDCFEQFCHLFECLDDVERSDIDMSHAANEAASKL